MAMQLDHLSSVIVPDFTSGFPFLTYESTNVQKVYLSILEIIEIVKKQQICLKSL